MTGLLSTWVGIRHIWLAVRESAFMTPEQFVEKAIAWQPILWDEGKPPTIYSRFFYVVGIYGVLVTFFGGGGLLFDLWQPSVDSREARVLALVLVGVMLVAIFVIMISPTRRAAC